MKDNEAGAGGYRCFLSWQVASHRQFLLSFCGWALGGGGEFKAVQGTSGNWMSTCREPPFQALPALQNCMLLIASENTSTWMANWFRFPGIRVADRAGATWLMLIAELFPRWNRTREPSKSSSVVDLQGNGRQDHTLRALPPRTETSRRCLYMQHHMQSPHITCESCSLGWMAERGSWISLPFLGGRLLPLIRHYWSINVTYICIDSFSRRTASLADH